MANIEFPEQLDLSAFISKEAHDLRSPFNRILGFTKMVLKGMDGPLTDMQREDLNTVLQNGLEATLMMSNLVDMARLGRREKSVNKEQHELNNLFGQAVALWKQSHPGMEIVFEQSVYAPTVYLNVDEGLMRQMLVNWINYVMVYVKEAEKVCLKVDEGAGEALFSIECQGVRMPGPSECHLTMMGYIGRQLVMLQGGKMLAGEAGESSTLVKFSLPNL